MKNKEIKNQIIFFCIIATILVALWLPTLRNPINYDGRTYSLLSESLIKNRSYSISGEPHSLVAPGHPLLGTPFLISFGKNYGLRFATLFWTFILLAASFYLFYNQKNKLTSYLIVILLLLNPFVIYSSMSGASDIVFSVFFILSLIFFKFAQRNKHFYYLVGITIGITCLIRYAGIMLFPIFVAYFLFKNYKKIFEKEFIAMNIIAIALFSLWLVRNYLVFGNPFYTDYLPIREMYLVRDAWLSPFYSLQFYLNPIHNILPIFFLFMMYGIVKMYRKYKLFILSMIIYPLFYIIWSVNPRLRHMMPLFPIFLFFAIIGFKQLSTKYKKFKNVIVSLFLIGILINIGMFFVYTYGETNYWIDKHTNIIPKDLSLSSEKSYSTSLCVEYINEAVHYSSHVILSEREKISWKGEGIFREDIILISEEEANICSDDCYYIEKEDCNKDYLFKTDNKPEYCVKRLEKFIYTD